MGTDKLALCGFETLTATCFQAGFSWTAAGLHVCMCVCVHPGKQWVQICQSLDANWLKFSVCCASVGKAGWGRKTLSPLGAFAACTTTTNVLGRHPCLLGLSVPQHRGGIIQCWALVAAETHSLELCGPGAHGPKALSVKERGWVSSTAKGAPVGASSPPCRWELRRGWKQAALPWWFLLVS